MWVKKWIARHEKYGAFSSLLRELKDKDPVAYMNLLRLNSTQFDVLLQMVDGMLKKQDTKMRKAILTPQN